MFKLDNELIKDRFVATSFSFYTDEEIQRLSVKQILNPTAFDHLGNPTSGGIYDKALGVSPFDHRSQCVTCGLDCSFCPGHVGHIELTAPVYNPFLFNHLYKLLKSTCLSCHRLRIHPKKINIYVMCLKLIKSGQVVASQVLKNYFLNAAKDIQLLSDQQLQESKKLENLKNQLEKMLKSNKQDEPPIESSDHMTYFKRLDKKFGKLKKKREEQIFKMFEDQTVFEQDNNNFCHTSILQKALRELIHELWSQVIPISCPHCNAKSPSFRKDGYTKIFQRPLSEKIRNQLKQQERLTKHSSKQGSTKDEGFEIITEVSTRKASHTGEHTSVHGDYDYSQTAIDFEEEEEEENAKEFTGQQKLMTPIEIKDHLEKLWAKEKDLLDIMFGRYYPAVDGEPFESDSLGSQMFFLMKLIVPPNRFRPESQGGFGGQAAAGDKAFLHAHSAMLSKILTSNLSLKDALLQQEKEVGNNQQTEKSATSDTIQKWIQLQDAINTFVDSSMAQKTADREQNGLRQLLERKEGMFRMKMMGKRVNFGARSVISPDPYITTDQIGVPIFMAKKLTFPESVSLVNAEKLRKLVMNGTNKHPGANMIEDEETGVRTHLETLGYQQRRGLAQLLTVGRKVVYRHLNTGDVLLVNRQPTLHKPSIMAHVARILPKEQTIRMHYANCSTYNADFDGDEMNLHFPQNYLACSEAYKLMATHKQYIVPTSGKPIRGLIQDSVISGVFLSNKDTFLTLEQYQQLVYVGLRELIEEDKIGRIFTLQPTIIKPEPKWTGKQVISTILKNIVNQEHDYKVNKLSGLNLDSKSKLPAKEWGKLGVEEGDVVIRDNELLQGTIDKNQFGASEFGMVHSFYEIYGSEKAGELLTALARIFTVYLQMHGFTCGLDDLVLTPEYNKKRRMIIESSHKEGIEAAAGFCGIQNFKAKQFNYSNRIVFQSKLRPKDKDIEEFTKMGVPENPFVGKQTIQKDHFIRQRLEDKFNSSEDSAKLDIEFDNTMKNKMSGATSKVLSECIPAGLLKRFPKNNISAMVLTGAKGGLVNMTQICCLLGQQELEGRRVPKMQNGKTLPCYLPYDPNPRSSGYVTDRFISGLRPQDFFFHCMAGREGLIDTAVKTSRSGYLQRCLIKQLESLVVNYDMTVRDNDGSIVQFLYGEDSIDVMNTKFLDKFGFLEQNFTSLITNYNGKEIVDKINTVDAEKYKKKSKKDIQKVQEERPNIKNYELNKFRSDPVLSLHHPLKYFGSISEKMDEKLQEYIDKHSNHVLQEKLGENKLKSKFKPISGDTLKKTYYLKYIKSLVNPGENVGTIAGQSIGEPSTQMTLNTFHLAGHGAQNMTLGVPRLKEILMTTPTHIKTPNMIVYFNKKVAEKATKSKMEKFANKFKRLKLSDLIEEVKVQQSIISEGDGNFKRIYKVTLAFENMKRINKLLGLSFKDLLKVFTDQFVPLLMGETLKILKKSQGESGQEEVKTVATKSGLAKEATKLSKKTSKNTQKSEDDYIEEEEEMIKKQSSQKSKSKKDDDEDEEEEEDEEYVMDIDGVQKKSKDVRGYEQEDEEDQDLKKRSMSKDTENENEKDKEEMNQYCNVLRERLSKYIGLVRGINYDEDKSATVEIGFPLEYKKILMLTVAETLLSKVLVRSVPGIDRCILITSDKPNEEPYLLVQGLNFDAFYGYSKIVDVNRIQTNDIWQMMKKYGVEAGRANLVKEVRSVFDMYGIEVNYRHLSLIGDFITFNGDYRAFNRIGMEESSSPFLKMSFETTMKYLVGSCSTKETDNMSTPSSALVMGQVPKVGTGIFDIIQDPDQMNE